MTRTAIHPLKMVAGLGPLLLWRLLLACGANAALAATLIINGLVDAKEGDTKDGT